MSVLTKPQAGPLFKLVEYQLEQKRETLFYYHRGGQIAPAGGEPLAQADETLVGLWENLGAVYVHRPPEPASAGQPQALVRVVGQVRATGTLRITAKGLAYYRRQRKPKLVRFLLDQQDIWAPDVRSKVIGFVVGVITGLGAQWVNALIAFIKESTGWW